MNLKTFWSFSRVPYKEKVKADSLQSSCLFRVAQKLTRILHQASFYYDFNTIFLPFVDLQLLNLHNLWRCALYRDLEKYIKIIL